MTDALFEYANHNNFARIADALEGLLALARAHVTPAAAPADFDSAQYADDFDAKMGNPVQALGGLSAFVYRTVSAEPTGEPRRRDVDPNYVGCVSADPHAFLDAVANDAAPAAIPAERKKRPWTHWSKVDPRSRELAKLATAAGRREKAAKTTATRDAARADKNACVTESKARQKRLRTWLDAGKGIIDGDAFYYFDAAGTKTKFVPSGSPHFYLPNS
jgi:hypothetical protein